MTTGLLVTITQNAAPGNLGGTRRSELTEYADMLERLIQYMVTHPNATSGTINDRNGGGNLVYAYTPIAGS